MISGYLASLLIFMKSHHNQLPRGVILIDSQWVFEYDLNDIFFVAALIKGLNTIDEELVRKVLRKILNSIIIVNGNYFSPTIANKAIIKEILDDIIKENLILLLSEEDITRFKPGILELNALI